MKKQAMLIMALMLGIILSLSACGTARAASGTPAMTTGEVQNSMAEVTESQNAPNELTETQNAPAMTTGEVQKTMMQMTIGETKVKVNWEDNDSVKALWELCREKPLTIQMSMYGGFEQVGPIGTRLPSNDVQTRTAAGDIVLYSSNQIVVFYGSNSWAYTRLGHIEDQDAAGMAALLGNGDVSITLSMAEAE